MVDNSKHRRVSKANVLFFGWCEYIVPYRIQDQLLSGLLGVQVVVVALLEDLFAPPPVALIERLRCQRLGLPESTCLGPPVHRVLMLRRQ